MEKVQQYLTIISTHLPSPFDNIHEPKKLLGEKAAIMTTPKYLTGDKEGIKDFLDQFEVSKRSSS